MTRFVVLSLGIVLASAIPSPGQSPSGVLPAPASPAGSSEEGRPLVRTYQPIEIGGGSQTWCILQDRRGVLYFGANSAVLQFDGASWRRIPVGATGAAVRSMAIDDAGRIYVGSVGTFGYLEPDATGALRFASLIDRLPSDAPAFNDVWRTFVTKDGVWFQTARALFRWADGAMTVVRPASGFNRATMVNGQVYLTTPETGLNVLEGTTLRPLPGTERSRASPIPSCSPTTRSGSSWARASVGSFSTMAGRSNGSPTVDRVARVHGALSRHRPAGSDLCADDDGRRPDYSGPQWSASLYGESR